MPNGQKLCPKCQTPKPTSDFDRRRNNPDGLTSWCRSCLVARNDERRAAVDAGRPVRLSNATVTEKTCSKCRTTRPSGEFSKNRQSRDGLNRHCKRCTREQYISNSDKINARHRDARYGLLAGAWEALFESQGRRCAICGSASPRGRGWATDHDHACCPGRKTCGKCIRGILCVPCNAGLGIFQDNPETLRSALEYLKAAS